MNRYALIIGVGKYDHLPNLSKPEVDAAAMRDVLQADNQFEVTLLNEGVTRDKLREALETLLLKRGKNSDVLIYFTGHGFTAGEDEDEAQGYLATQDCRVEIEGNRVLSARKGFSFQSLNGLIARAELSSLVMLLDCCHGGSFIESGQAREKLSALNKTRYCLITACRSFEQAYAMTDAEHSVFSGAVLAALRVQAARVTALDVQRRVEHELKNTGQEPLYVGAGSDVAVLERRVAVAPTVSEECPYQGLRAFQPETARFFFGREAEKRLLWERLQRSNFVAVLGPSGSGKSSVVRAGLAKRLEDEGWQVLTMMPGGDPLGRLRAEVERFLAKPNVTVSAGGRRRLVAALEEDGLLTMAEKWAVELPGVRVLLLVDQFEEVFTQCAADRRDCFIRALVAVGQAQTPLAVVMTMRSDFYNEWLLTGQPSALVSDYSVPLSPLRGEDCEDLKAAIVEPARLQGYEIEPELLALLLEDVTAEENSLPLLEFALEALWKDRDSGKRVLTVAAYRQMEKLTGALNRQAEKVYEQMREPERAWAKRICLQLVRIGRDGRDTRQRQQKETLLVLAGKDAGKRQTVGDVIQDLVDGRLLVSGGDERDEAYVDVAHEALLEGWRRFAEWRQENREQRQLEQRLRDAYEEWIEKKESDDYLLSGGLLAELRERNVAINETLADGRPELMRYFSLSDERERQKVAALEQALAKADIQEASRKVRDKLLSTPAQTVSATVAAISLVGKSQNDFDGQVVYSSQDALHCAWFMIRERLKLEGHSSSVYSVAFSPQGDRIVSGSTDNTLRLW
ncbi:MAG: caspase family protein, partial [Cyanobacteria bacterium J06581_3]